MGWHGSDEQGVLGGVLGGTDSGLVGKVLNALPLTVLFVVGVGAYFQQAGIRFTDINGSGLETALIVDPTYYATALFIHRNWAHFTETMVLVVPFGIVLTWLTSNRHVLGLAIATTVGSNAVSICTNEALYGASSLAMAMVAATLIWATGYLMSSASYGALQSAVMGVFISGVLGLLILFGVNGEFLLAAGGFSWLVHFNHFAAFLFGGAIAAIYLFSERENEQESREVPRRVGM